MIRMLGSPNPPTIPRLDYVVAVLGCVAARVPAIPAYPPQLWNRQAVLQEFAAAFSPAGFRAGRWLPVMAWPRRLCWSA